jgi:membrane associated rhomboid family serine protease
MLFFNSSLSFWYEIEQGKFRVAGVVLFGSVGGCVGHAIVRPTDLVGASGAVWALITANIVVFIFN